MIDLFKKRVAGFDSSGVLDIAFADVTFEFSKDTLYPNLCVRHKEYGLVSPVKGRTVATLPEIHLALRMGCKIIYHEAVVIKSGDEYVFRDYLKGLIDGRNKAKREGNTLWNKC